MAKTPKLPFQVTLVWGYDRLVVEDPAWIERIVAELGSGEPQGRYNRRTTLRAPISKSEERVFQSLGAGRPIRRPDEPPPQVGFMRPEDQKPVAAAALKEFLGLELPVALNFVEWGRSRHRMTVVQVELEQSYYSEMAGLLEVYWNFSGYQLYHSHQMGAVQHTPYPSESGVGHIERRLLNGQWVRWGFDGPVTPPEGYTWSFGHRDFLWTGNSAVRYGSTENDVHLKAGPAPEDDDEPTEEQEDA